MRWLCRQQPSHRRVVVRRLPVPLRHVDVMIKVQVVRTSPFAQPMQVAADQLTRRLQCEQLAGGRMEGESSVVAGGYVHPPSWTR